MGVLYVRPPVIFNPVFETRIPLDILKSSTACVGRKSLSSAQRTYSFRTITDLESTTLVIDSLSEMERSFPFYFLHGLGVS